MNRWKVLTAFFLMLSSVPAFGDIRLQAECDAGTATITVSMLNTYGQEYVGVVVMREPIGVCEDPVMVTTEPIPLPPETSPTWENVVSTTITASIPVDNVNYKFTAYLTDSQGGLAPVTGAVLYPRFYPFDVTSCGAAVIMRGSLHSQFTTTPGYYSIWVTACSDGCWGDQDPIMIDESVTPDNPLFQYSNTGVVDIIGKPFEPDGMMYPYFLYVVDGVQAAPAGACGPVPNESRSWGHLKAMYR